jgi:pyruvate dehydrogenase E2 component (dihydrolipoamide acetyltransferase)
VSNIVEIRVPDIGDFKEVPVIEVLLKPGDAIGKEDPLITLESDKATMDVPAPQPGVVKDLRVKKGDKVSEGSVILTLEARDAAAPPAAKSPLASAAAPVPSGLPTLARGSSPFARLSRGEAEGGRGSFR